VGPRLACVPCSLVAAGVCVKHAAGSGLYQKYRAPVFVTVGVAESHQCGVRVNLLVEWRQIHGNTRSTSNCL
jgi:hypothetical protein